MAAWSPTLPPSLTKEEPGSGEPVRARSPQNLTASPWGPRDDTALPPHSHCFRAGWGTSLPRISGARGCRGLQAACRHQGSMREQVIRVKGQQQKELRNKNDVRVNHSGRRGLIILLEVATGWRGCRLGAGTHSVARTHLGARKPREGPRRPGP